MTWVPPEKPPSADFDGTTIQRGGAEGWWEGAETIRSDMAVAEATPTLQDRAIYRTARSGKSFSYKLSVPPGLYDVHLKFAELRFEEPGKRRMDIAINGRPFRENWDPATHAGMVGMSADLRAEDIVPDKDGKITIAVSATGTGDAILQGMQIE